MTEQRAFSQPELQRMADELTMGDVWRSRKEAPDDRAEVGMRSFWHAALRLEIIGQDVDFEAFIDRVRSDDFRLVNESKAAAGKAEPEIKLP